MPALSNCSPLVRVAGIGARMPAVPVASAPIIHHVRVKFREDDKTAHRPIGITRQRLVNGKLAPTGGAALLVGLRRL